MTVAELVIATVREARPKPQTGRPAVQTRPLARISHSPQRGVLRCYSVSFIKRLRHTRRNEPDGSKNRLFSSDFVSYSRSALILGSNSVYRRVITPDV